MNVPRLLCAIGVLVGLLGLTVQAVPVAVAAECSLRQVASIPADFANDRILLTVGIDGNPARFVLDTGSPLTTVSAALAARLGLGRDVLQAARDAGIDGQYAMTRVKLHEFRLGSLATKSIFVTLMPAGGDGTDNRMAGLLGGDILQSYDVELDPADGLVKLFDKEHCNGQVVYWAKEWFQLPFLVTLDGHMEVDAALDGRSLRALVDTGAPRTMLDTGIAAGLFGVHLSDPDVHSAGSFSGAMGRPIQAAEKTFKTLQIGPLTLRNPRVVLLDSAFGEARTGSHIREHLGPPFTIGMNLLSKMRSYIAFSESKIYFTLVQPKPEPIE